MILNYENKFGDGDKLKYPKSVFVILLHQGFERFSYWGIVVVLPLFLRNVLGFDDDSSTSVYHGFLIFGYLSAFVGAILADSFLGKFWTITSFSVLYFVGTFLLTLSAIPTLFPAEGLIWIAVLGMALTALASGSIKPCIIAFGGDQFVLPQQQKELEGYFPILLLVINFVLLCTAILTPMMRQGVSCLGQDTCYPLTFAVPLGLVIIGSVIFVLGKNSYRIEPVKSNVVWDAFRCIKHAISERHRELNKLGGIAAGSNDENSHWLDRASDRFGEKFVQDLKRVLKLVVLFLPVTTFWALFDQQFSRWTFQASRMNGNMFGYSVKPDQVAIINFILTFLLIPVFDKWLYPALGKFGLLKKSLQRVVCGCILASFSFMICACVELRVESTLDNLPLQSESRLNVINLMGTPIHVQGMGRDFTEEQTILPIDHHIFKKIPVSGLPFSLKNVFPAVGELDNTYSEMIQSRDISLMGGQGYTLLIYSGTDSNQTVEILPPIEPDDLIKSLENNVKFGIICTQNLNNFQFYLTPDDDPSEAIILLCGDGLLQTPTMELPSKSYSVKFEEQIIVPSTHLGTGGSYIFAASRNDSSSSFVGGIYTIREPNSVSMLWLLPQYLVMSMAEVLLEIPLTGFAYEQAPTEMKSLLQVVNLVPPALGGMLVVVLAKAKLFDSQAHEFFFFAGVNFISVLVLIYLARDYKPLEILAEEEEEVSTSDSGIGTVEHESDLKQAKDETRIANPALDSELKN